jgi:arsenate reductase (glutaredoxin)
MAAKPLVLSYSGCQTCKKALRWLADHGVCADVRAIVLDPPTTEELEAWIPKSGKPVRKWLNTSGQSYRALDKERVAGATDQEIVRWLARDGKLVKRPVVVTKKHVIVGFDEAAYRAAFAT